jgi:quercetin dioxygenase-like cupin family protein
MNKLNVYDVPLAANVCNQLLREIPDTPAQWSMAHVTMNPHAVSLLHRHRKMTEIYAMTKGCGQLEVYGHGADAGGTIRTGNVQIIKPSYPHRLRNIGMDMLEHLVLAAPHFDPTDVEEVSMDGAAWDFPPVEFPEIEDCFDGARIMSYELPRELETSMAYGWAGNDPHQVKKPHYHKKATEYIFVVEGWGLIEINKELHKLRRGDWLRIDPGERHALRRTNDEEYMAVRCIYNPAFAMDDVYYD